MNPRLPAAAAVIISGLFLAACSPGAGSPGASLPSSPPPASSVSPAAPGLAVVHDPGQVTGTLSGPCHARGQLPDRHCTPGSVDTFITAAKLCAPGYSTRGYRPPASQTQRFKYEQAYPAYGLSRSTRTELDHLVSLELGGSNDATNLWPEVPPTPNPKDSVEAVLHAWVCSVTGTAAQDRLHRAQLAIADNWVTAEKVLGVSPVPPASSSGPAAALSSPARTPAVSASLAPAHVQPASPVHIACYPLTSGGNCYEPGEFCRKADLGASGVAGDGRHITCTADGSRSRWVS